MGWGVKSIYELCIILWRPANHIVKSIEQTFLDDL